ncbi:MAG TPA: hypothetical protein VG759_12330 [Candidatus Angelobacter sp.]|nr:hypothetical protein [Candidatus Angelobacter sp.]
MPKLPKFKKPNVTAEKQNRFCPQILSLLEPWFLWQNSSSAHQTKIIFSAVLCAPCNANNQILAGPRRIFIVAQSNQRSSVLPESSVVRFLVVATLLCGLCGKRLISNFSVPPRLRGEFWFLVVAPRCASVVDLFLQ